MSNVKKKRKKPIEEKVGQVKPLQSKDLTSPLCGACLEECHQPHSRIAALQIHRELAVVASMHNEGPEGPHGESSATCVQWCGWGSCCHRCCIQRAQLIW